MKLDDTKEWDDEPTSFTGAALHHAYVVIGKTVLHLRDVELRHVAAGATSGTHRTRPSRVLPRRLGAGGDVAAQAPIIVGARTAVERAVWIVARRARQARVPLAPAAARAKAIWL